MQVRSTNMGINTNTKLEKSPQSFGFHLAGEPARLFSELQKESPDYFKWVTGRIMTNYAVKNTQAASDIMDFYLFNGLIKSCVLLSKKDPSSASLYKQKIKEFSQNAKNLLVEIGVAKKKNPEVFNVERIHEVLGSDSGLNLSERKLIV